MGHRTIWTTFLVIVLFFNLAGCNGEQHEEKGDSGENKVVEVEKQPTLEEIRQALIKKYSGMIPVQWGEQVEGVKTYIHTNEKVIALTFDACGGPNGIGYDEKLINFLQEEQVPATLFINGRWIDENEELFRKLATNSLSEIENHGTLHCSFTYESTQKRDR